MVGTISIEINSDGGGPGAVNTQYSVQMMCCGIVRLKPA